MLIPFTNGQKCGFQDSETSQIKCCEFQETKHFIDGIAPIKYNDKWGFFNIDCETIISIDYDEVIDYKFGLAIVKKNNIFYLISKFETVILSGDFRLMEFIDLGGQLFYIYTLTHDLNKKFTVFRKFDFDMEIVLEHDMYSRVGAFKFSKLYWYYDGNKYGILDKNGNLIISCKFDNLEEKKGHNNLEDGYIISICNTEGRLSSERYGLIRNDGIEILEPIFNAFRVEKEFIYTRIDDDSCGIYDHERNIIVPNIFTEFFTLFSNYIIVRKEIDGKLKKGLYNKQGHEILPCVYDSIIPTNSTVIEDLNGYFIEVVKDNLMGFFNLEMEVIVPCEMRVYSTSVKKINNENDLFEISLHDSDKIRGFGLYSIKNKWVMKLDIVRSKDFQPIWDYEIFADWLWVRKIKVNYKVGQTQFEYIRYFKFQNSDFKELKNKEEMKHFVNRDLPPVEQDYFFQHGGHF